MKIVHINELCCFSTGNIAKSIIKSCDSESYLFYTYGVEQEDFAVKFHKKYGYFFDKLMTRIVGIDGIWSFSNTKNIIKKLDEIKPDIIHIHNLHGFYINYIMMFKYIKKKNIKVIWTLHDCWSFTGHCAYFDYIGCNKWKEHCGNCPQRKETRLKSWFFDNSSLTYKIKKKAFTGVKDLTIVTPSNWLANMVKQSFLKEYSVKNIYNGIDLSVFKPTKSDFREKNNCEDKYVILGVASTWGKRKGLDVFFELAERLDKKFQIVLVGNINTDKRIPDNIIYIPLTQSSKELAEIYTAADLFVNPTREEVLGLVNIESLACGTPGVTFCSGGSPECYNETCGSIVPKDDVDALYKEILRICYNKPYSADCCLKMAKNFDKNVKNQEYIDLYNNCNCETIGD